MLTDSGAADWDGATSEIRQVPAVYDSPRRRAPHSDRDTEVYERRAALLETSYSRPLSMDEQEELADLERRIHELRAPFYRDVMARIDAWEARVHDRHEDADGRSPTPGH